MSDIENEMDVDVPAPSKDITFSSEVTKGKRTTANLPVEAEDSLPWYAYVAYLVRFAQAKQRPKLTLHCTGLKSTDLRRSTTSPATRTSWPR